MDRDPDRRLGLDEELPPEGWLGEPPGPGRDGERDFHKEKRSRRLKDLLHIMERIEMAGAGFRSLTEAIDTTTAAGWGGDGAPLRHQRTNRLTHRRRVPAGHGRSIGIVARESE